MYRCEEIQVERANLNFKLTINILLIASECRLYLCVQFRVSNGNGIVGKQISDLYLIYGDSGARMPDSIAKLSVFTVTTSVDGSGGMLHP